MPSEYFLLSKYMCKNLIVFSPTQTVLEVMELLQKHRISGGPVLNESQQLIGMISESDCIKQIAESTYYNMPMHTVLVTEYMDSNLMTISCNLSIFEAAQQFYTTKKKRFPVMDGKVLVGQISQSDIVRAILNINNTSLK